MTRVALSAHVTPVSRIIRFALAWLKQSNNGLRLVVSYADPGHGHYGGIYQAGNWIYAGDTDCDRQFYIKGKFMHSRSVGARGWVCSIGWIKEHIDPDAYIVKTPGKHRYLMPLDEAMRCQIAPVAKPYPKREKQAMTGDQPGQRRGSADLHAPNIEH